MHPDTFGTRSRTTLGGRPFEIFRLESLEKRRVGKVSRLPFSIRILLENLLRHEDGLTVTAEDIHALANWSPKAPPDREIAFRPARDPPAGLHRRPGARGPGGDARRGEAHGRGPEADQPADAGGPGHRPLRAGGPVRLRRRLSRQRGQGVRAQRRAVRVPAVGEGIVPELPRRPPGHRDLPPGEPGVPGAGGVHAEGSAAGRRRSPTPSSGPTPTRR